MASDIEHVQTSHFSCLFVHSVLSHWHLRTGCRVCTTTLIVLSPSKCLTVPCPQTQTLVGLAFEFLSMCRLSRSVSRLSRRKSSIYSVHICDPALLAVRTKSPAEYASALSTLTVTNLAYITATLALAYQGGPTTGLTLYEFVQHY